MNYVSFKKKKKTINRLLMSILSSNRAQISSQVHALIQACAYAHTCIHRETETETERERQRQRERKRKREGGRERGEGEREGGGRQTHMHTHRHTQRARARPRRWKHVCATFNRVHHTIFRLKSVRKLEEPSCTGGCTYSSFYHVRTRNIDRLNFKK